ncbi:DUF1572 family protein [Maribacter antarcticus]|uniref:DUF1572 family protein n=1 Tax=Maribacter antarcticus TaxID=505250 RepID=UPI000A9C2662|nr:DUF1572 family protein [Maribacter antarcticus]
MKEALKELFNRDLTALRKEIELYRDEAKLWKLDNSIQNSGGTLCLHVIGNLKTFIGNALAQTTYVRDREFEFSGTPIPRTKLYQELDETIAVVNKGFDALTEAQLDDDFPIRIWEEETKILFTLMHLHGHLTYHLGQLNYHRRILDV